MKPVRLCQFTRAEELAQHLQDSKEGISSNSKHPPFWKGNTEAWASVPSSKSATKWNGLQGVYLFCHRFQLKLNSCRPSIARFIHSMSYSLFFSMIELYLKQESYIVIVSVGFLVPSSLGVLLAIMGDRDSQSILRDYPLLIYKF